MKKKILSTLLAAAMVLTSCLPVFAEGEVQPQPTPETPAVVNEEPEEFCDCGLAKGHEGECQKAAEEFCECGLAKDHEGECQKAAEEFCECGLAKNHEGECQKAAEEFCECGLAKGHEGDCQKAEIDSDDVTVHDTYKGTSVEITGAIPENVELVLNSAEIPVALMQNSSIEKDHVAFSLDISLQAVVEQEKNEKSSRSLLKAMFGSETPAIATEEWQPAEGETVSVTMYVDGCEDGQLIAVFHEEHDGTVELVDVCTVVDEMITFEAKSFSSYIGVVVYYQFSNDLNTSTYLIRADQETTVEEILQNMGINLPKKTHRKNYNFLACINADGLPTYIDTDVDVGSDLGFDDSWSTTETERIRVRNGLLTERNDPLNAGQRYATINMIDIETNSHAAFIYIRSNLSQAFVPPDGTMCFLFEKDSEGNQTFWVYDEATDTKIEKTDILTLEEAAYVAFNTYGYTDVKILMNDTYQAGKELSEMEEWKDQALQVDGIARVNYEELWPQRLGGEEILIQRYEGFTGPLIQVNHGTNSPFDVWAGVTIDNKSPENSNLTAVVTTNNGSVGGGLMIFRGTITDSNAMEDGEYRGVGVKITSTEYVEGTPAPNPINRDEGGVLELENGSVISGFHDAVLQLYGTTCVTHRQPENTYVGIDMKKNTRGIVLYHNNRLEKWSSFDSVAIKGIEIYLEQTELWKSGDIVLASGYEWQKGDSVPESVDGNSGYDHWWTPVKQGDADWIEFQNETNTEYAMNLKYYGPHDATDIEKVNTGEKDRWRDWSYDKFHDPYPVIRFEMLTVYNVQLKKWYHTLGEAVADSGLDDGNELVFYGSTNEAGTVVIDKNVTIRSSYEGEKSWSESQKKMIVDARAGDDCTATWNRTDDGNCLYVVPYKTVNLVGKETADKDYGTLTFDANSKGRVIALNYATVNMEDGITLTKGNASGFGGGVMVLNGTFNMTGGTVSNNTVTTSNNANNGGAFVNQTGTINISGGTITGNSAKTGGAIGNAGTINISGGTFSDNSAATYGGAIYQYGIFNLSGSPVFSGNGIVDGEGNKRPEDVYLPASATTDAASGFYVITKAGGFGFTDAIDVTLGNSDSNLYDGRNVVEGSTIDAEDLEKFDITNDKVVKNPDQITASKFAFVYANADKTPDRNGSVLELDIRADLKIEKVLVYEEGADTTEGVKAFTFKVTLPDNATHQYQMYQKGQNGAPDQEISEKAGEITGVGTIDIEAGHYVIIRNIDRSDVNSQFTVKELGEVGKEAAKFAEDYTVTWGNNTKTEITAELVLGKVNEVTCTNTKLAKTSTLELTKSVAKAYAGDADPNVTYTFRIDFAGSGNSGKTGTYRIGTDAEQSLTDGGTITLSKDQTAVITMPVGAYTIEEIGLDSNKFDVPTWTGAAVNASNENKVSGTLEANVTDKVNCQNNYKKQVGDLVITKTITEKVSDAPSFLFHVKGDNINMRVTIAMNGEETKSVTIKDLPLGTYTVTEETDWSKRYGAVGDTSKGNIQVTANQTVDDAAEVSFTNKRTSKWLTWDTHEKNLFDGDLKN